MKDKVFLDTNVVVYALLGEGEKARKAMDLLPGATISVQVLNELVNVAKKKAGLNWSDIEALIPALMSLVKVELLTADIHIAGLQIGRRFGLSVYDSMIVSSAVAAKCGTLYTEDMQHEQAIDAIVIRNPFRS